MPRLSPDRLITPVLPVVEGIQDPKAAEWMKGVKRALEGQNFDGFVMSARVEKTADQAIVTATGTKLTWDSLIWDCGGEYLASTNTRLRAQLTGIYAFSAGIRWAASAIGNRTIALLATTPSIAGLPIAEDRGPATAANGSEQTLSTRYYLRKGDYIEVEATQTSGGNLNVQGADMRTFFEMTFLGAFPEKTTP